MTTVNHNSLNDWQFAHESVNTAVSWTVLPAYLQGLSICEKMLVDYMQFKRVLVLTLASKLINWHKILLHTVENN